MNRLDDEAMEQVSGGLDENVTAVVTLTVLLLKKRDRNITFEELTDRILNMSHADAPIRERNDEKEVRELIKYAYDHYPYYGEKYKH